MTDIHDDLRELIVALRELRDELRKGQNALERVETGDNGYERAQYC